MNTIEEITQLEERLRDAELGPDPAFFEEVLADDVMLDRQRAKAKVVEAHQPGSGPKFSKVEISNYDIVDHGVAAVVTCDGTYEGPRASRTLSFMRVWLKRGGRWQIIAGSVSG
ncbi:MAG: nuclear transport factor 2 family protein [Candidatus Eremiobacter antarcticus]